MNPSKMADAARYYRRLGQHTIAEHWEAELVKAGRCKRCGRSLTDPVSVERGIGPECVRKASP